MFGIISDNNSCNTDNNYRKNYCGTCKAIGLNYGQSFRLVLNNDIVFLSELYDSLKETKSDYSKFSINNCLSIPNSENSFPFNLQYAASAHILLSKYSVLDNIIDSKIKLIWKAINNLSIKKYNKAESHLKSIGVDTYKISELIFEQMKIEKNVCDIEDVKDILLKYSNPTALITSEIFQGIIQEKGSIKSLFKNIGFLFGQIAYLTDAIKDVKEDRTNNNFNPLLINSESNTLNIDIAKKLVNNQISEMTKLIISLPIYEIKKQYLLQKISTLYLTDFKQEKIKLKERIRLSIQSSKNISKKYKYIIPKYSTFSLTLVLFIIITFFLPNVVFAIGVAPLKAGCCESTCDCCGSCCTNQEKCNCAGKGSVCENPGTCCDKLICSSYEDAGIGGCFLVVLAGIIAFFGCGVIGSASDGCSTNPTKIIIIRKSPDCGGKC